MPPQVSKKHYRFQTYSTKRRWNSYWHQIEAVLSLRPKTVLEIGPANTVVGSVLREEGIRYKTADVAKDLAPDYLVDIRDMDLKERFDLVMACQVLEHLPYDDFDDALMSLAKHSKRYVMISLPHFGPFLRLHLSLWTLLDINRVIPLPLPKKLSFDGQHYWEIGRRGYPARRVRSDIQKHFRIIREFRVNENPFHHFFVLEKD